MNNLFFRRYIKQITAIVIIGIITLFLYLFNSKAHSPLTDEHVNNILLPSIPIHNKNPYGRPQSDVTLQGAAKLEQQFNQRHYNLAKVRETHIVPRIFVTNLPSNLNQQPVTHKINDFIRLLLPTVLLVNQQILQIRNTLLTLNQIPQEKWTAQQQRWLKLLTHDYRLPSVNINKLLKHIDIIPTSMALAQGIDESGWGTGYFAIKGNNLYGEHLPVGGHKYLVTPDRKVKVAAFDSLYQSTAAYFYNLNASDAYQDLRALRFKLRTNNKLTGLKLIDALESYSIRGQAYVANLHSLIINNHLESYDKAKLNNQKGIDIIRFNSK